MTILQPYKGFQGSIEYDAGRLYVRVLHIADAVSTKCDAASEAESSFRDLVDDYLETCREVGKEPNKPFKGSFNVRIKPDLHREAAMSAESSGQSLNAWIETAIAERLGHKRDEFFSLPKIEPPVAEGLSEPAEVWVPATENKVASLDEFRELAKRKTG